MSIWNFCGFNRFEPRTNQDKFRRRNQTASELRIKRFVRRVCKLDIGASMCFCVGRVERSTRRSYIVLIKIWAQSCNKDPRRRVKTKLCEDRKKAANPNDGWYWTSCIINWPQVARYGSWQSSANSPTTLLCWMPGSTAEAKTSVRLWATPAGRPVFPGQPDR